MPLTYGTRATTKLSQKNGTHRSSSALPTSPYGDLSSVSCTANSQTQVTDRIDPQIIAKSDRRRTNLGTCYLQCLQRRGRGNLVGTQIGVIITPRPGECRAREPLLWRDCVRVQNREQKLVIFPFSTLTIYNIKRERTTSYSMVMHTYINTQSLTE